MVQAYFCLHLGSFGRLEESRWSSCTQKSGVCWVFCGPSGRETEPGLPEGPPPQTRERSGPRTTRLPVLALWDPREGQGSRLLRASPPSGSPVQAGADGVLGGAGQPRGLQLHVTSA